MTVRNISNILIQPYQLTVSIVQSRSESSFQNASGS